MKIRIESYDDSPFSATFLDDFNVSRIRHSDVANVDCVPAIHI